MFEKIGLLVLLGLELVIPERGWCYLFSIKSLTKAEPVVEGVDPVAGYEGLYRVTGQGSFNIIVGDSSLAVVTQQFSSKKTPSTFLYPEVKEDKNINSVRKMDKFWKIVSNGRGFYTLILADSSDDLDAEEEEERSQAQEVGDVFERIIVQSSANSK